MAMYCSISEQKPEDQLKQSIDNRLAILKEALKRFKDEYLVNFVRKYYNITNSGLGMFSEIQPDSVPSDSKQVNIDYIETFNRPESTYTKNKIKKSYIKVIEILSVISDILNGNKVISPNSKILSSDRYINIFKEDFEKLLEEILEVNEEVKTEFKSLNDNRSVSNEIIAAESFLALSNYVDKMQYMLIDYGIITESSLTDVNLYVSSKKSKEDSKEKPEECSRKLTLEEIKILTSFEKELEDKFSKYKNLLIDFHKNSLNFVENREIVEGDNLSSIIALEKSREIINAIDDILSKKRVVFFNMNFNQAYDTYVFFKNTIQNCFDEIDKEKKNSPAIDLNFSISLHVYKSISSIYSNFKSIGVISNRITLL